VPRVQALASDLSKHFIGPLAQCGRKLLHSCLGRDRFDRLKFVSLDDLHHALATEAVFRGDLGHGFAVLKRGNDLGVAQTGRLERRANATVLRRRSESELACSLTAAVFVPRQARRIFPQNLRDVLLGHEGEAAAWENRAIQRRIDNAHFPVLKTLDTFQWGWPKKINRQQTEFVPPGVHLNANQRGLYR